VFTAVVTNAHGVCGNCGEVAFQYRKCRDINYDRPDGFLCVEYAYRASESFSFELTAGVATNAVAISNDIDHERAVKILGLRRQFMKN
jgi:E3 ubiquitin-protein ligase UBR4